MAESDSESLESPRKDCAFFLGFLRSGSWLLPESVVAGSRGCGGEEVRVMSMV